ncbi:hypothetical protein CKO25_10075 [Thiocapsa imhoffii]|uniref:Type II secretion system protein GspC N-terminal domain-containing protein n=1 Tax=Thiocapsa imhoffii TaxID=382777 RepID=A0A9X1B9E4_9GAMM|nr:type II secretion system protein N [Thiocapsa imhoffii]MBK1644990.1 hypothetical protein [Thiocapsa imhoffii]
MRGRLQLLALCSLALVLFLQWKDWPPDPTGPLIATEPTTQASPETPFDPTAQLLPTDPKDAFASVIERPLFRFERRPEEEDAMAEEPIPEPELGTSLLGMDLNAVIITPELVAAWVQDPGQPKLRRLRIGDDLAGWSVTGILPDRILLERQGREDTLILRDFGKLSMPASPEALQRRLPQGFRPPNIGPDIIPTPDFPSPDFPDN